MVLVAFNLVSWSRDNLNHIFCHSNKKILFIFVSYQGLLCSSRSQLWKNISNYSPLTYQNLPTDFFLHFIKSWNASANCTLYHFATGCLDWLKSFKKIIITLNICPIQLGLRHWFLLLLIQYLGLETILIIIFVIQIKKSYLFLSLIKAYFVALALSYGRISQITHLSPIKTYQLIFFFILLNPGMLVPTVHFITLQLAALIGSNHSRK